MKNGLPEIGDKWTHSLLGTGEILEIEKEIQSFDLAKTAPLMYKISSVGLIRDRYVDLQTILPMIDAYQKSNPISPADWPWQRPTQDGQARDGRDVYAILDLIINQSQLCMDNPIISLPEEICEAVRKLETDKYFPTREEIGELFNYDPETGIFTWKTISSYRKAKIGDQVAKKDAYGYPMVRIKHKKFTLHKLAWFLIYGEWITWPMTIDHVNGDRSDNRMANLRKATVRMQNQNRPGHRSGRLVGCTKSKDGKWEAHCKIDTKTHYLGRFFTEIEAHTAYVNFLKERNLYGLPPPDGFRLPEEGK